MRIIFFLLLLSSTAYCETINNESKIKKNFFEDKNVLSFVKSFDNSNAEIIDLVLKKNMVTLESINQ